MLLQAKVLPVISSIPWGGSSILVEGNNILSTVISLSTDRGF